ncbi:K02A2.6-like [Cordylochernes scorpioides]|uniref:K02A2.6-like n=1 Tax=Cordylochernes scorpioides TaxID=51811 RepID=A0ABY6K983_9ARAC|nr:K02A2.6-like [Cordylochernes scorpioides]
MTHALVDSGASYSVISERLRLKLRKIMFAETDVTLRVANGRIARPKGRCTLKLDLNGLHESFAFVVMEDCSHEVILGWDFLKLSRAIIDSADDTLFLEKCLFEDTPKNSSPLYSELEYRIEPASIQLIEVASRDIPNDAIVVEECRKELLLERELTAPSSVISLTSTEVYFGWIDDTLDCLRGARFYSSMDLQSGYWQIDVEESDRGKTAFITPDGLKPDYVSIPRNASGAKTITILGHEVSENGIRPDQEKIRAVRDFATPRSLKEVRSFLGLSSYYRRFIPNYAHVAQPLNDLLKKDSAFNWNQEEQNAFEALNFSSFIFITMDRKEVCKKSSAKKNMMSIELKREIIEKHEQGVRVVDLSRQYGRNHSVLDLVCVFSADFSQLGIAAFPVTAESGNPMFHQPSLYNLVDPETSSLSYWNENSAKNEFHREIYREKSNSREYVNPPADGGNVNLAVARGDVTSGLPPATSSNGAARALRNWADCPEDQGPGADDDFTVVRTKKRRHESANSPTAAAPSSNIGGARTSRRPQSSAGSVPRAQEIRTTRAHITEARARQASSSEDLCVYLEHGPELQPFHYLRALDRMLGGTAGVIQVSKVNGHQLLGLANRGLAERLINEGLEVEGTLLRAFPFRKRAERITVGNLPFFVEDSAIISALKPYGRVTSIAPKLMKAGPYTYNDGRREAFIVLREGMATERLPTRLEIPIKGEAWPAYLSSGIKCSRCHGQGHRRANCPLLAGRTNAPRPATPISPTSVPPVTAPGLPRQPSAHPPPPASPSPAMETPSASPAARAVTPSAAPRPSTPVAPAVPVEMAPPAPPPVTPAPSLRAPGGSVSPQSTKSGPPAQDIEMTAIEESSASSTSSSRTSMRDDLVAFIQRSPTVSFTGTDALGLGREEVLDLLSSRTKAQRKRGLLTPPQTDALAGLIEQILGLKPAGNTNVYKILHQVKSELKKGPAAVPPTPPLPAPRPAGPTPPVPHGVETKPAMATPPPPLPTPMEEEYVDHEDLMEDLFDELNSDTELKPLLDSGFSTYDLIEAILHRNERALLIAQLSPSQKIIFAGFIDIVIWRAQHCDNHIRQRLANFRKALNS